MTESRSRLVRILRWFAETLPGFAVALVILPWIIAGGTTEPWAPATIDLDIYRLAVLDGWRGGDFYQTTSATGLYFIYPPVVIIGMAPLMVGPYLLWQILWTFGLVCAQQAVLRRVGVRRGWPLALVGMLVVVAVEPIRTTLGYGQVNTFLMLLGLAAVIPDAPERAPRWVRPRGLLIGVAAAIKLTPAYLAVIAFFSRRAAVAWWAFGGFVVLTGVGFVVFPEASIRFWSNDLPAETSGAMYVGNQAISGLVTRWFPMSLATVLGAVLGVLVGVAGIIAARHWWLRGHAAFAVGLAGLITCLVTPLSWTHHFVWVLPFGAALALGGNLPAWIRGVGGAWAGWIALGLPLAVLPYRNNAAGDYTLWQDLIANLTPLVGIGFVLALAVFAVRDRRAVPVAGGRGIDLSHGHSES